MESRPCSPLHHPSFAAGVFIAVATLQVGRARCLPPLPELPARWLCPDGEPGRAYDLEKHPSSLMRARRTLRVSGTLPGG